MCACVCVCFPVCVSVNVFMCVSVFVFSCFSLVFVNTGGVCIGDWMFDEGTPSLA